MKIWDDLLDEVKKNLPDEIECELKFMHSKKLVHLFFEYLYQRYLSEKIEQPLCVFLGIDEQDVNKKEINTKKIILLFNIFSPVPRHIKCSFP